MLDVSRITLIKINNKKTSIGLNFNISKKKNLYYNSFFFFIENYNSLFSLKVCYYYMQ